MAGGEFYRSAPGEEDNSSLSGSGRPGHYFGGGASEEAGRNQASGIAALRRGIIDYNRG